MRGTLAAGNRQLDPMNKRCIHRHLRDVLKKKNTREHETHLRQVTSMLKKI